LSILTKISVVVLVVLNLAAALLFINLAAVGPNYRWLYEQEQKQSLLYAQTARNAKLAAQVAQQELNTVTARLEQQIQSLNKEIDGYATRVRELQDDKVRLEGLLTKANAEMETTANTLKATTERTAILDQELKRLRETIVQINEDRNSLAAALRRAQDEVEKQKLIAQRYEEIQLDLRTQIRILEDKLDKARRGVAETAAGAAETSAGAAEITGTVTSVRDDRASIDVGSAQGVREGMELVISRGDKFVGYLTVEYVLADQSAGFVHGKQLDPAVGDRIMSSTVLNNATR